MKKFFLLIVIATLLLPNLLQAGKYRAKGWWYGAVLEGAMMVPDCFYGGAGKIAIGLQPPYGFGIGVSIIEGFGLINPSSMFYPERIGGVLPLLIYFVPYANWDQNGFPLPIIYSYFSINQWLATGSLNYFNEFPGGYLRIGTGIYWVSTGLEVGFYSFRYTRYQYADVSKAAVYFSFNLSLGLWKGRGIKEVKPAIEQITQQKKKEKPDTPSVKKEPQQPSLQSFHFPPDLAISEIKFSEASDNKALDAYEKGEISFVIENKGKGNAQGVSIRIVPLAGEGLLEYTKQFDIDIIPASSQKSIKIPINATGDTKDEIVKLRIETYEALGFDAEPFTISFETRKFNPAILTIASVAVDDDKEGDSYGDNDGIIELGEQIEVSFAIQNKGIGDANNTTVELIIPDEGKNLYFNSPTHQFNLGNIVSGGYKQMGFVLALAKRYDKENILIKTKIDESTGKVSKVDSVYLPVGKPSGYGKEITIVAQKEKPKEEVVLPTGIDIEQPIERYGESKDNGLCVIIGIEEYKNAPASLYSNRDATTFYDYAKNVLGIKERNIYITTNEDATKGEFDKIFGEDGWLARRVNQNSEIFIYFSGHGSADMKTQKQYLVPYDIDPNYPQTAYSLDKIYECLSRLGAKSTTIFLDACFSGQSRQGQIILAGARPLVVSKIAEPLENITVLSATSGSEIASAYTEKKHGLFTYFLLKGLRGDADLNKDKTITTMELSNYLTSKVPDTAQDMGREQHPQLLGKKDNVLVRFK